MNVPSDLADILQRGRDAVDGRAWPDAYQLLTEADARTTLSPHDLELLAKASWWTGRPNASIDARERAYGAHLERGDKTRAAFMALTLRREHSAKMAESVATGWLNRAEQLLKEEPESLSHGYLAIAHGSLAWDRGELDQALTHVDRAAEIGERFENPDLRAWAAMYRGMLLVDMGRLAEGWLLMEELSAAAVGGELGGYTTGGVFCNVISMCRDLADYARASEWADAAKRWCERQAITGFPGICRVHRAEVMRLLGTWTEAEAEIRRACDELSEFNPVHAGAAFHELGEVRLRLGDLRAAEEAFGQAHELGEDPQPGLARLLLADGKVDAAVASIRRSLEEETWNRLARARLLPALAEIAYAQGEASSAQEAADELEAIAQEFGTSAIRADAACARGIAFLLSGAPDDAARALRRACQLWREVDAPYETARTGVLLAEAYLGAADKEAAGMELRSAGALFARLGAEADTARVAELLASLERSAGPVVRARRTFLFTDIVGSTALLEAIGDEAWTDLRRWHDEALRTCIGLHGGAEVDHAGDGFFVAFPDTPAALECAIQIQRKLAEHRHSQGFSPGVRMGLHAAEVSHEGRGYSGRGVHLAARIGALAQEGEILASAETLDALEGLATSAPREVELKGIAEPVVVRSIYWR